MRQPDLAGEAEQVWRQQQQDAAGEVDPEMNPERRRGADRSEFVIGEQAVNDRTHAEQHEDARLPGLRMLKPNSHGTAIKMAPTV